MSTSAISNILTASLPNPQGAGKSDAPPDGAFNQVLSREIDNQNRPSASSDTPPSPQKNANDADKAQSDNTAAADDGKPAAASAKAPDAEKGAHAADGKTADKDGKDDKETDPTSPSSLIAFVAGLAQPAAGNPAAPVSAEEKIKSRIAETLGNGKAGSHSAVGQTASNPSAVAEGKDPTGKGKVPDFSATLDKAQKDITASEGTGKASSPAGAASTAAAAADAASVALAAKALKAAESPSVAITPQNAALVATTALQANTNAIPNAQLNQLLPQVGTDDWGQALGQKVVWMVQGVQQSATLSLNPPDLGPLQVVLHVSNNQATANFTAHQPEVRQALESAMPRLRDMLSESGIQLGQSSVSAGLPNQQNNASGDRRAQGNRASTAPGGIDSVTASVTHVPVSSAGNGLVDTFA